MFRTSFATALLAACWLFPASARADDDTRGAQLFSRHCAVCHDEDGRARGPVATPSRGISARACSNWWELPTASLPTRT